MSMLYMQLKLIIFIIIILLTCNIIILDEVIFYQFYIY